MNKRVKELRLNENLSQDKFATKLGVSRSVISNIEYGKVEVKEYLINLMVSQFKVNKDWLLTGNGEMYTVNTKERELSDLMYELGKEDSELYGIVQGLQKLTPEHFNCVKVLIEGLPKKES